MFCSRAFDLTFYSTDGAGSYTYTMHKHIQTYTHTHLHINTPVYIHTYISTYIQTYIRYQTYCTCIYISYAYIR